MANFPQATTGAIAPGSGPSGVTAGGDVASAIQVVLDAANSGAGRIRLTTQSGTAAEVAALVLLTGSSVVIGAHAALVLVNAGVSVILTNTWDEAVTAIAAS